VEGPGLGGVVEADGLYGALGGGFGAGGELGFVEAYGGLCPDFGGDVLLCEELVVVLLDVACFYFARDEGGRLSSV